jgi:hypothetical protein
MVNLVLTPDQVRSAPAFVRQWIRSLLAADFDFPVAAAESGDAAAANALAECSLDEAALVLQQIQNDYLACQVFFDLGREEGAAGLHGASAIHRTSLAAIMQHVRLPDIEHLVAYLDEIARAYQRVRGTADAALLAVDRQGDCYIHETTRRSIRALWKALVTSRLNPAVPAVQPAMPAGPAVVPGVGPAGIPVTPA